MQPTTPAQPMENQAPFQPDCRRCARLAAFLQRVRGQYPAYHAAPVAAFGDPAARLLIIGLAPGLHGANATGRPFTGDYAGILLYRTLHRFGFANRPESRALGDGLELRDCRITNAVKCLPPANKPTAAEVGNCNGFLRAELNGVAAGGVLLALGTVAHNAIVKGLALKARDFRFGHGREHVPVDGRVIVDSYHCSRYNTQTRRLTPEMFHAVFARARQLVDAGRAG